MINFDARIKYLDSSIWNRYVPLDDRFEKNFGEILAEVDFYFSHQFYETNIAKEFIEFQTRMLANSYLPPIQGSTSHGIHVMPFKFHSESRMTYWNNHYDAKLKFGSLYHAITKMNIKWRFLLVDDYATTRLRGSAGSIEYNKHKLIEIILSRSNIWKYITVTNGEINLWDSSARPITIIDAHNALPSDPNATNSGSLTRGLIDKAYSKICESQFDIILLDYLLGERDNLDGREYGHELLKKIEDEQPEHFESRSHRGPYDVYWIFPISAFTEAMLNDLRGLGYSHLSPYWHLSSGADPINTPQLFLYKLFTFMQMQVERVPIWIEFFNKHKAPKSEYVGALASNKGDKVRKWASEIVGEFMTEFGLYNVLRKSQYSKNGNGNNKILNFYTTAWDSLQEAYNDASIDLYEHTKNLLCLLAFGSSLNWHEMWSEFISIQNILGSSDETKLKDKYIEPLSSKKDRTSNKTALMEEYNTSQPSANELMAKNVFFDNVSEYISKLQRLY